MSLARAAGSVLVIGMALCACSLFAPREEPDAATTAMQAPGVPPGSPPGVPPAVTPGTAGPALPPAAPPRQPPLRENKLSPATRSLVDQAHGQIGRGDLPAASSTLERALRIEPNNPLLWTELGKLRLAEDDARQAESCARKALALASGDHGAQAHAGRLLADALRAQRRNQEAHEVETQPYMSTPHE